MCRLVPDSWEDCWLVAWDKSFSRGRHRWLVRVFVGRDRETRKRRYHNRTVHGTARRAQEYLTKMLRERDLGRGLEGSENYAGGISGSLA